MAYTERYVTSAASGGGNGTSGSPWTLSEAVTNAASGDRINIQSDGAYSISNRVLNDATSQTSPICYRGYNSTIGDLDAVGRDTPANGSGLLTANMPAITLTGTWNPGDFNIFMNLNFTSSIGAAAFSTAKDWVTFFQCKVVHSGTANNVATVHLDNQSILIMCDFETTGANPNFTSTSDHGSMVIACKFKGSSSSTLLSIATAQVIGCLFINGGTGIRLENRAGGFGPNNLFMNNTAYNLSGDFLETPNLSHNHPLVVINNHVTDSARFLNNTYSATDDIHVIMLNNRTRDITNADIGVGDGLDAGNITTDTGGAATDFTDAANEDFSLISGAPGEDAGLAIG